MKESYIVRKSDGQEEYFSIEKLFNSLIRSKASIDEANAIIESLKDQIHEGISTKKIHSMAFRLLKKQSLKNASRYHLKKGMMELGPAGYAFETYIGDLFSQLGYETRTSEIFQGKCVSHEVDVIAENEKEIMLMECKYKNMISLAVDVKVPLYIHSRFNDILENDLIKDTNKKFKGWIVTNSRFTEDAIAFGKCKGIHLLSWDYPHNKALKDLIDSTSLYPVTCLTTLSVAEKKWFLDRKKVLVKDLDGNKQLLKKANISEKRIPKILEEITNLCDKDC
jgi:hypothetical protein